MKRRDILKALGLSPLVAKAQVPCPPIITSVDGVAVPPGDPCVITPGGVDASIVPSLGRTVWNPGIYQGIPDDNATGRADGVGGAIQHGATLPAGSSASTIQSALNAAAAVATKSSRRFVKLGPGLFNLTGELTMRANVTLRGTINANGYTRDTILRRTGGVISFLPTWGFMDSQAQWGSIRSLTVNAQHGDGTITLNDASNFNVGDLIHIDTLRDAPTSGRNYALPISYDPPNPGNWCWNGDGTWFMRQVSGTDGIAGWPNSSNGWRVINEVHEVLAKNGNTITIYDPNAPVIKGSPIRSPMYRSPEAYNPRGTNSSDILRYAGLEDLKIEPGTTQGGTAVYMNFSAFCWLKNVEIHGNNPNTNFVNAVHMHLAGQTYRCELTGCYFHGFDGYGPGGAYSLRLQGSDHYIHNNVFRESSKPIMLEHSGGGNVIAYNYVDDAFLQGGWPELAIGTHLAFVHYELYEGNWASTMGADATHGNNGWITMFRNFARGHNSSAGSNPSWPIRAVNIGGYQREMYSIGNVLLDPALSDNVSSLIINPAIQPAGGYASPNPLDAVYLIGWGPVLNGQNGNADEWDNGEAGRNFHRHLDFDSFTNSQYDNPANPVKALPPSLHRETAPSYFAGYAWPWIDPTASTHANRVKTLPAKARYDAGRA